MRPYFECAMCSEDAPHEAFRRRVEILYAHENRGDGKRTWNLKLLRFCVGVRDAEISCVVYFENKGFA